MSDTVRALDANGDWLWGQGTANYLQNLNAVVQNIQTNILSFVNDCFFDTTFNIDWFNILGTKNELAVSLAISAAILNTNSVTGILQLNVTLGYSRQIQISYNAQTVYGATGSQTVQYDLTG